MKHAKFDKLMSRSGELPTLPVVAHKVVEVIQDPRSSARTLRELIELDPVISARLLRIANSAYYRMAGSPEVGDVQRAVVVLGFTHIRNIVLATCLNSLYSREFKTTHFSARDLWIHSVTVAVVSRLIAQRVLPEHAEEAFMAGLVHDVGMVVEWNLFPDVFPQVLARFQGMGKDFTEAERETLGFDHCAAGAYVLRTWKLPKPIRDAAAKHHRLDKPSPDASVLPEVVQAAEYICQSRGEGFFDLVRQDSTPVALLERIGLGDAGFGEIAEQTADELDRARDLIET